MKPREKSKTPWLAALRPLGLGLCVGALCCTLLLLLAALLMNTADIPHSAVAPLAVCAAGFGAFAAGLTATLISRKRGLLTGAACGILLYLVLLLSGLVRDGGVDGVYALIKAAVLTVCGAVGGILGVNRKRR